MTSGPDDLADAVEFNPKSGSYSLTFDGDAIAPSRAILAVLASAYDAEYVELEPLFDYVDPEALDAIFAGGTAEGIRLFRFTYRDHQITVGPPGRVEVAPLSDDD